MSDTTTMPARDDEYIAPARDVSGEKALMTLEILRDTMTAWESRLVAKADHPSVSAEAEARAQARLDVVRDVLSIIGR